MAIDHNLYNFVQILYNAHKFKAIYHFSYCFSYFYKEFPLKLGI